MIRDSIFWVLVLERERSGNGVRLNYGTMVPNDSFLIGDLETLVVDASAGFDEPMKARRAEWLRGDN